MMRYCSNCGTQNDNDAKFCSGCGAKLESAPAAPVEDIAEGVQEAAPAPAPIPAPVPTDDFVQQAPQFDQQPQFRAADPAPQYQQPQQPQYGQAPAPQYQQAPQYGNQGYTPYQQTVAPAEPISARCRTFGIISFVLGICSIVFCWLGIIPAVGIGLGLLTIAFGVVGLIFSGISRRAGHFTLAKLGKIFSIIGLCLSGIMWIVGIIITASGYYYYY